MRKTFKLDEIDCASCALKLERAIRRVDGVQDASINFMMQRLTLEAADERFEEVLDRVVRLTADLEPDCEIRR
ncbi:Heavy metal transport/detoxification protein [Coriobacterium glomerans PW2]|uniref:Heavy metal transport/detoxification protein n=1 Tax=Coriobacterium glomerans (strain ATCC 49209 / DSM 20642 / JCM 10262 / PW2) TaxID=700015 RepID=F2NBL1_CORGP|nr:heavy metal-associated domain-containing protein [Coriobacterium glomerans]AEB06747.1 Heavy metal transport/detoxification protein [Coriobacterium glomerans PW2]